MGNSAGKGDNPDDKRQENDDEKPTTSSTQIKEQTMEEFNEELRTKREHRRGILSNLKSELDTLRSQLKEEKLKNSKMCKNCDKGQLLKELASTQFDLQLAQSEVLSLTSELDVTRKQVTSLKSVVDISKQMIDIREGQVGQLKTKLKEIEDSLNERELKLLSEQLRKEYTHQLEKMKALKVLYEEKARITAIECDNLKKELASIKNDLVAEVEKTKCLTEELGETATKLEEKRSQLTSAVCEAKQLQSEMTTVNELSSQILMGFNSSNDINIDKLTEVLEENRGLLTDMTAHEITFEGASALPKVLFDLVIRADRSAVDGDDEISPLANDSGCRIQIPVSTEEIVEKLPKVWRILMEFLNHHQEKPVLCLGNEDETDCYKPVQTPTGTEMVLSVSKTFIKLKDLILEKTALQKETNRLKSLNKHLDDRLRSQENRLGVVTVELTKTWHLVGKMQRQHRQLHTNEQILRYQLQRKRVMLNELKVELEYCRKKWAQARQKNNDSEDQWRVLQKEFASRKLLDANNSAESGYSDDQNSDEDIEPSPAVRYDEPVKHEPPNDVEVEDEGEETLEHMFFRINTTLDNVDPDIPPEEEEEVVEIVEDGTNPQPSTSRDVTSPAKKSILTDAEEEYTARRTARIKRLEEQCAQLLSNVTNTVNRGDVISNQLDTLHERYDRRNSPSTSGAQAQGTGEEEQLPENGPDDNHNNNEGETE